MFSFKEINSISEINHLSKDWVPATKFNKKTINCNGRSITLIKMQRNYSTPERILRAVTGIAKIIFSLGIVLVSNFKNVKKLFTCKTETIRFGISSEKIEILNSELKKSKDPIPASADKEKIHAIDQDHESSFKEYTLRIGYGNEDQISVTLGNVHDENRLIEEIAERVNHRFEEVMVQGLPSPSIEKYRKFTESEKRVLRVFGESVEILDIYGSTYLLPKIAAQEPLEKGKVKILYKNGVIEEVTPYTENPGIRDGIRRYPTGCIEAGTFLRSGLTGGYRFENGIYTVFGLHSIVGQSILSHLHFLRVVDEGMPKLIPVSGNFPNFQHYEGSREEALIELAKQPHSEHIIKKVLKEENHGIDVKQFVKGLFTSDRFGVKPILLLGRDAFYDVLKLIEEHHFKVDLHAAHPISGETLFNRWSTLFIDTLLTMDSTLIKQKPPNGKSYFAENLLKGNADNLPIILKAMEENGVELSVRDRWFIRAYKNDLTFKDEEFTGLDSKLKAEIYEIANVYAHEDLVTRLNLLGMDDQEIQISKLDIVAPNMDCVKAKNAIGKFYRELRERGCLMTQEEFNKVKSSADARFYAKGHDMGRILGRDYIEKTAGKLNIGSVKVPKKIAVIEEGATIIKTNSRSFEIESKQMNIQATGIKGVRRFLTRQEMAELILVLEATGFSDIHLANFVIAKDGVYVIDTEYTNFQGPDYGQMFSLLSMVSDDDQEWMENLILEKEKAYQEKQNSEKNTRADLDWDEDAAYLKRFGFRYRVKDFAYDVKELLGKPRVEIQ